MTAPARRQLDETLSALRAKVLSELPAQIACIANLSGSIAGADPGARAQLLRDLERAAHGVAGRAAMFELPELCEAATALEQCAEKLASNDIATVDVERVSGLVTSLVSACHPECDCPSGATQL